MRVSPSSGRLLGGAVRLVPSEPGLLIETGETRTLIASDLHIGFEKSLARKGINIPSQTKKLLAKMKRIVKAHRATRVILLGDVKHGTSKILMHEWTDIPEFFDGLQGLVDRIEIVPGNHDGGLRHLLPPSIVLHPPQGVIIESGGRKIVLIHGHAWPLDAAFSCDALIMGHHHFTFEFRDPSGLRMVEQIWLLTSWDAKSAVASYLRSYDGEDLKKPEVQNLKRRARRLALIVLPAFNPLLGGSPVNRAPPEDYLGPIFTSGGVDMGRAEIFLLDGTPLGRLGSLGLNMSAE